MQTIYCANCGTRLNLLRKALPKFGRVITLAEYHECPDEPVELDLTPIEIPKFENPEGKDKFVQNLNDIEPSPGILGAIGTEDLRDRRPVDQVKSSAPASIIEQIQRPIPSTPANDTEEGYSKEPEGEYEK